MDSEGREEEGFRVAYHLAVDTFVELPLSGAALPQLVIPVVEALPVLAELRKTVGVDVLEPAIDNH